MASNEIMWIPFVLLSLYDWAGGWGVLALLAGSVLLGGLLARYGRHIALRLVAAGVLASSALGWFTLLLPAYAFSWTPWVEPTGLPWPWW
ncbi:hypothetical protein [Vogesella sp. AC12]|uniref:hypothetical protein n=1 Tax=Vogesella sp. AC12 TaxID=2950550 RepID=UPI002108E44A|nr:hypothetical protein [Vogesella sp. AC12]MCQ4143239.1 hypothetical protein [Vogesella sp. AC12]